MRPMAIGNQRRPSPEISRSFRAARGIIGLASAWIWLDKAVSRLTMWPTNDVAGGDGVGFSGDGGGGLSAMILGVW